MSKPTDNWIGVGQESSPGEPTAPTKTMRCIPMGSDVCMFCEQITPLAELDYMGTDPDQEPVYRCKDCEPA